MSDFSKFTFFYLASKPNGTKQNQQNSTSSLNTKPGGLPDIHAMLEKAIEARRRALTGSSGSSSSDEDDGSEAGDISANKWSS